MIKTRKLDRSISDVPFYTQDKTLNCTDNFDRFLFKPCFLALTCEWLLEIGQMPVMHERDVREFFSIASLIASFHQHYSTAIHEQFQNTVFRNVYAPTRSQNVFGVTSQGTESHLIHIKITNEFSQPVCTVFLL